MQGEEIAASNNGEIIHLAVETDLIFERGVLPLGALVVCTPSLPPSPAPLPSSVMGQSRCSGWGRSNGKV